MSKSNNNPISQHKKLQNLSTEELKAILRELQSENVIMEAKNDQLASHVTDLRDVIKCVEKQRTEELNHLLHKKERLIDQISRNEAALKVVNSKNNTMYTQMLAFKELQGNQ